MSAYQVLARKWRPRFFREMVGQEHVLRALINALDHNRLHHAYLFTGTRGVGKTTIARILAKCLNCEVGVSSEPCGQCSACQEIAQGSFVDLIEVDAASRTKVEDTRELLDNVQYAPTKGRFKVYLIDEVHMLSTHSFNALLKTLEEPPEHVKFLLATTDPQKIPPTILSRCLQFHLKNMSPERIVGHLNHVLTQEMLSFDEPALWALARSANGSMRDALSLTDQAIAFGTGTVQEEAVAAMLGSIDQNTIYTLMQALINFDAAALLNEVARFSEHAPDYVQVLDALLMLMHRMSLAQVSEHCVDNSEGDKAKVVDLAAQLSAEELQLFYQMGLLGKKDLGLAPDLRTGFEMCLLRMLTFRPEGVREPTTRNLPELASSVEAKADVSLPASSAGSEVDTAKKPEGREPLASLSASNSANIEPESHTDVAVNTFVDKNLDKSSDKSSEVQVASVEAKYEPVQEVVAQEPEQVKEQAKEQDEAQALGQHQKNASANITETPTATLQAEAAAQLSVQAPVSSQPQAEVLPESTLARQHAPEPLAGQSEQISTAEVETSTRLALPENNSQWLELFAQLPFQGLLKSIAAECVLVAVAREGQQQWLKFVLNHDHAQLLNARHGEQIQEILQQALALEAGVQLRCQLDALPLAEFAEQSAGMLSPMAALQQRQADALAAAKLSIAKDEIVQDIVDSFDGMLIEASVRALH